MDVSVLRIILSEMSTVFGYVAVAAIFAPVVLLVVWRTALASERNNRVRRQFDLESTRLTGEREVALKRIEYPKNALENHAARPAPPPRDWQPATAEQPADPYGEAPSRLRGAVPERD